MLELQRELSAAIARQVRLRLSPERLTALAPRHTRNAEAYDLYLRGRHLWNQLTPETNRRAVESYQKATQLDPEFALAWAGLADIYSASPINSDVPPWTVSSASKRRGRARGRLSALISPRRRQRWARCITGSTGTGRRRKPHFEKPSPWIPATRRPIASSASCSPTIGRHEEAREAMRRARELEPFYPMQPALSAHVRFAGAGLQVSARIRTTGNRPSIRRSGLASSSSPRCTSSWATMNRRCEPWRSPSGSVKPTAR